MHRRFRPICLAALCWLLIALVPATRNGLIRAGNDQFSSRIVGTQGFSSGEWEQQARLRFPRDRDVLIAVLPRTVGTSDIATVEAAASDFPDDPTVISLVLRAYLRVLKSDRNEAPLSNPNFPAAPPAKTPGGNSRPESWAKFLALAWRGQKLEPDNTFFDWMLLYGLYATRRDADARAQLKLAARKTGYNDHSREIILSRLAAMRKVDGAPLSPRDCHVVWETVSYFQNTGMNRAGIWVTEGVIADREAKQHPRALDTAFDLLRLSRVMRRQSYAFSEIMIASGLESLVIRRATRPLPARTQTALLYLGAPLSALQNHPLALYSYAQSQNRADITRYLD